MAIYENITREEYNALDGINASSLKHFHKSIRNGNYHLKNKINPTPAMKLGTAIHKYILEFDTFFDEYLVLSGEPINPKSDKPYGKDTKKYQEFLAALPEGKEFVSVNDLELFKTIAKNIEIHEDAPKVLDVCRNRETAVTWTDETTGIKCKALIDYWGKLSGDLKTIAEIKSKRQLAYKIIDMLYDVQFSFYHDGLKANGIDVPFTVLFTETTGCNDVCVFDMDSNFLDFGRKRYLTCLENYKNRTSIEVGIVPKIETLSLPWEMESE